jgi:hypothetical protein
LRSNVVATSVCTLQFDSRPRARKKKRATLYDVSSLLQPKMPPLRSINASTGRDNRIWGCVAALKCAMPKSAPRWRFDR